MGLENSLNGLTTAQILAKTATMGLTDAQKAQLIELFAIDSANYATAGSFNTVAASQATATASTNGLSTAFKGLWATMKAHPFLSIASIVGVVGGAIYSFYSNWKQEQEEARQEAVAATDAYNSTADSIQNYADRYRELHSALIAANGDEEETRNIKQQLLELQQELNAEYGNAYGRINLVTDAYKDQTAAILEMSEAARQAYINQNLGEINNAMDEMSKDRTYTLGYNAESLLGSEAGDDFAKLLKEYENRGVELIETLNGVSQIQITANAEDANAVINDLMTDLRELQSKYSDVDFSEILSISENELNESQDIIDKWKSLSDEGLMNEILSDNTLSDLMDRATEAVEKYNEAVINSEDPFNDEAVISAYQNIVAIDSELGSIDEKYHGLFNDVLEGADISAVGFAQELKDINSETSQLAESLEGLTATELQSMADDGTEDNFDKLIASAEEYGLEIEGLIDLLVQLGIVQDDVLSGDDVEPASFSIADYEDQIDDVQSSIQTLRDALDSFNSGELDYEGVLDLMQEFPELSSYVDLAADGFGNLSEGLSQLIEQQPTALIQSLQELKLALNTDEERAQVDELINSLQLLGSYGDTGAEAYVTAIGDTWSDTANVIDSVTTQFENLAKVQEAVSNGLTMSATAAAELARMYPEILTQAEFSANGQVTLNEAVVQSILQGDQSIIDAQIAKLEADKAELTAKKEFAEAQLNIIKQVSEGEANLSREAAADRVTTANNLLQALIQAGLQEDKAYLLVTKNMAQNTDAFNSVVGMTLEDIVSNINLAAVQSANNIAANALNAQEALNAIVNKAHDTAEAISGIGSGQKLGSTTVYDVAGGVVGKAFDAINRSGLFNGVTLPNLDPITLDLDAYSSQLELDIQGYTDAISNIDAQIEVLKNLQATFDETANSANGGISGHNYADRIKDLENEKDAINSALDDATSGSSDSTDEIEDDYEELVDFFERRTKVLSDAFDLLDANIENVIGSSAKNALIDAQANILGERMNNYTDALAMYQQKADEVLSQIPSDLVDEVVNGAVQLTDFIGSGNEQVVDAIQEYQEWADKVADCKQELAELKEQIRQLELEKFNNIIQDFTDQFDIYGDSIDLIDKQIALFEEAGELIGENFYSAQIEQSQKQLNTLEEEKARLIEQLNSALASGRIEAGTDEWLEMTSALSDVEGEILNCKTSIEEFDNAILQLHWDIFDRIQNQFSAIDDEISNIIGLIDDVDVATKDNQWTTEGLTQLGLLSQQYELARYQVKQYEDEINQLNSDYLSGRYSATEYADKLIELNQAQWDAVNAAEAAKDAIVDLNEARVDIVIEGIEEEIDAFKELTDAQIENLEATQELYEYQQEISEKSKSVADLEKQLAAMQNDDTASTIAQRKLLEEQLAEARQELEDAEYEHSIEAQKDALNQQYEDFETARNNEIEALRASLEAREQLIFDSMEAVKANATLVGEQLTALAQQQGIVISDAIVNSWKSGENAIASYGSVLTAGTSAFIGQIMGVENEVYQLQNAANNTAMSLANTFSVRADALVAQLVNSYNSAANANAVTQALQASLINTLERGYNINGITSAMSGIVSGANSVADAANKAADAINRMNSASASGGSGGGSGGSSLPSISSIGSSGLAHLYNADGTILSGPSLSITNLHQKLKAQGGTTSLLIRKNAKGGLVTKDDSNPLNNIAKAVGEDVIIAAKAGESVLSPPQTEGLLKLAPLLDNLMGTWNNSDIQQTTLPSFDSKKHSDVNIHYDSLVTINGDVNDTNHFIKQIKQVSKDVVDQSFYRLSNKMKYS